MTTKDVREKLVHLLTTNPELPNGRAEMCMENQRRSREVLHGNVSSG